MPCAKTWRLKSPLIQRLRDQLRTEHKSPRTEEAYVHWCSKFFAWANCGSKDCLDGRLFERYMTHIAVKENVSASTQNQAFNALLFLFVRVLGIQLENINAVRAKRSERVPEWLTKDEVRRLVNALDGDWKLLTMLGYGTGLRLMELLRLRVRDLDFGNGIVTVRDGKGGKDRIVPLPKSLVGALQVRAKETLELHRSDTANGFGEVWLPNALARKYPSAVKSPQWQWLFPSREICKGDDGKMRRHHLFPNGFQTALRKAAQKAGITKRVHPHLLRHSFATSYLQNGGSLYNLQALLGHKDVKTTMIYTHCVDLSESKSPLDALMAQ